MTDSQEREASKPPYNAPYAFKKQFYRDVEVATHYDDERFAGGHKERRNRRKWAAIRKALAGADSVRSVLDLPCGTGRFTGHLVGEGYRVAGSDISVEMMGVARARLGTTVGVVGFVQSEAERLPFPDDAFDCVVSIRFLHHVDSPTRVEILREMGRVARWLVVDYRHRYSYHYARWRLKRALGMTQKDMSRVSRSQLEEELTRAGVALRRVVPVTRGFSDKWVVLGEVSRRR